MKASTVLFVGTYLAAIVAANLSISHWGTRAAIWNAVILIGFDLVTRDRLHDAWKGHVLRNMSVLIVTGSVLSYVAGLAFGNGAFVGQIALASGVAFAAATTADTIVYHLRRKKSWSDRSNESNVAGAAVDSLVFAVMLTAVTPIPFSWAFVLTLWSAKVAGGYCWSLILRRRPTKCDVPGCKIEHANP